MTGTLTKLDDLRAALRIIENYPNLHMGPSVPFVLGALQRPIGQRIVNEHEGRAALRDLILALKRAPQGRGVRIQWCRNIKAYVATSMPFVDGLAWDVECCSPDDFDGLIEALWRMYGSFIQAGEYSIDDYVWHPLTAEERSTIEQLTREALP